MTRFEWPIATDWHVFTVSFSEDKKLISTVYHEGLATRTDSRWAATILHLASSIWTVNVSLSASSGKRQASVGCEDTSKNTNIPLLDMGGKRAKTKIGKEIRYKIRGIPPIRCKK